MSESQSRYSIVERLTDKKMSLIEERDTLELDASKAKQEVEFRKKNLEKDKKSVLESAKIGKVTQEKEAERKYKATLVQAEREREASIKAAANIIEEGNRYVEKVDRDLEKAQMLAENLQTNLKVKKQSIDSKIATIDEALKRLEEISKTAPQN